MKKFDIEVYTTRRMKELRGEKVYSEEADDEIERYIKRHMTEMRQKGDIQRELDKSPLGCYTVGTMGDRDGQT